MRLKRRNLSRQRSQSYIRRTGRFESLEARQMLNAAPVANDDAYTVGKDGSLALGTVLPPNITPIQWAENGHSYAHVPGSFLSWRGVETAAANMRYLGAQGHLVSITSAAEEAFILTSVVGHLPQESRVYVGLTDRDVEGQWKWVTGESVSYTHWRPGEPTTGNNDEDFGAMYYFPQGWQWGDIPDNGNYPGSYIVEFDGPPDSSVLANDTDADNNPLTATVVAGPQHGTLQLNSDGAFTYTPEANYLGVDTFTYKANDGQADSNVAKVTITVTPNSAPVANDDTYTVAEDGVLALDSLPGGANAVRWTENGHYYAHIPTDTTWLDAEIGAKNLKFLGSAGHLVTINSAEEHAFILAQVTNHLPSSARMFIGITDRDVEGTFRWVTGEPVTFTKWGAG